MICGNAVFFVTIAVGESRNICKTAAWKERAACDAPSWQDQLCLSLSQVPTVMRALSCFELIKFALLTVRA